MRSCAVALANLDLFEREDLLGNVLRQENAFRQTMERLYDSPIVGDVRGDGYFYAVELVKDKATKQTLTRPRSNGYCAAISLARRLRTASSIAASMIAAILLSRSLPH